MKLKLDEHGNVVLEDGKPVFVNAEGKDVVVDVSALFTKIGVLNSESAGHRRKLKELTDKSEPIVQLFADIDNPSEWFENAKKAVETVKNLDQSKLLDADKVETLKSEIRQGFEAKITGLTQGFEKKLADAETVITGKDQQIYKLMVSSHFSTSPYFSGESPKTTLLPDIAETFFGQNFKVEEGADGSPTVVGYIGENKILSTTNPGEPAGFDEALTTVIDAYPMKDRIMKSGSGGSGSGGGSGGDGLDDKQKLKAQHAEAKKAGNVGLAIALKNKLHALGENVV